MAHVHVHQCHGGMLVIWSLYLLCLAVGRKQMAPVSRTELERAIQRVGLRDTGKEGDPTSPPQGLAPAQSLGHRGTGEGHPMGQGGGGRL